MITHTRFTIADDYALLGNFGVPGVQGKFEVRSNKTRKSRPLLIVVHENWRDAGRRERVEPVVVVQLESDGRKKITKQEDSIFAQKMNLADFGRRAIELFQLNGMEHSAQCHHG